MYPVIRRRIQQTAHVFIYPPRSRNHPFLRYNELAEPGDGLSSSRVADFAVEKSLQLGKEGEVPASAIAAGTKEGFAAVLEVKEFCFTCELVSERLVEPVYEGVGRVAGVVKTGDGGLAEHGVGVYVVVGLVDVVHVCPLFSADIWEAYDFCRIHDYLDLIEVGVLVLCVYCNGAAKFFHERHLAHCVDPCLHSMNFFVVVRDDQLKLRLVLVLHRSRHKPYIEQHNA